LGQGSWPFKNGNGPVMKKTREKIQRAWSWPFSVLGGSFRNAFEANIFWGQSFPGAGGAFHGFQKLERKPEEEENLKKKQLSPFSQQPPKRP
jgi:hypothetical protein